MKWLLAVPFFAMAVGCASPGEQSTVTAAAAVDGRARLVVFGDSVSYCQLCFPSLITAASGNTRLDNRAVAGSKLNSADQLTRILAFDAQPGDRVVFLTGYNDVRAFGTDVDHLADYQASLRTALTHLARSGQPVYVGTTQPSLCVDAESRAINRFGCDAASMAAYVQVIKDEVARAGLTLVDVNAEFTPTTENLYDMVHPNGYGSAQLATIFLRIMR